MVLVRAYGGQGVRRRDGSEEDSDRVLCLDMGKVRGMNDFGWMVMGLQFFFGLLVVFTTVKGIIRSFVSW